MKQNRTGMFVVAANMLWRFFSSVRLALILILIITGLSLLGALTALDVFRSVWFALAGVLLMLNIIICSMNRWRGISAGLRGSTVKHPDDFYSGGDSRSVLSGIPLHAPDAAEISEKVLKTHGYRVRTERDKENTYLAADKNRYFRLGTFVSHFSLVLFVLAFITGSHFGFCETAFTVPEGNTREVGHDTGLALHLLSFVDEYYDNGMPRDYRSQVVLYDHGQEVAQSVIRVNHPLYYHGIRFYQSFFGPAVRMLVIDASGQEIFRDNIPLEGVFNSQGYRRHEGYFDLPRQGFRVRIIGSAVSATDPMIPRGQIAVGVIQGSQQIDLKLLSAGIPRTAGGLEFTFLGESAYSGFQVSRDPTNALVWIASVLFLLGIGMVLYFPYYQVWVRAQSAEYDAGHLFIRASAPRSFNSAREATNLVNDIKQRLPLPRDGNG